MDRIVHSEFEHIELNRQELVEHLTNVLQIIDLKNTDEEGDLRGGIKDTPERYAKFLIEFMNPPQFKVSTFESESYDEMILVKDIPFYSLCEHHIAPFFGTASIAYIPNPETKRIVGLSKLPRILDHFSRRLQNQERITTQVADFIQETLNPLGVAVSLNARHMCMEMRGVQKSGANTVTNKFIGVFKNNDKSRLEFLQSIK